MAEVDDETREGVRGYAIDPSSATRLWAASEQLVGQVFSSD